MIRLALLSFMLAFPAVSTASDVHIGDTMTFNEVIKGYGSTRAEERAAVLRDLERVCQSKLRINQRKCDAAWRIIADGYQQLQARKAATAAK